MLPIPTSARRCAPLLIIFLLLAAFLAAAHSAQAGPVQPAQEATPAVKLDTEGTPALLLTPLAEETGGSGGSSPRALLMTGILLMCGMVGMLVGGIGIAMILVRLRNRLKGE